MSEVFGTEESPGEVKAEFSSPSADPSHSVSRDLCLLFVRIERIILL